MPDDITLEHVQALITRAPFHQWLGLTVVAVGDDSVEIKAKWREEWVVNVERRYTHGGILAALIDLAADFALIKQTGRGVPTIDMRVDYHRVAMHSTVIGHLFKKQVDSVRPGEALFLRRPENSDPPGGQGAVSSRDAEHNAAPRFFEGSCHCGRDDRDS